MMKQTKNAIKEKYLYIFLHMPKTAGSTFRWHIERNICENERISLYTDVLGINQSKKKHYNYSDYYNIVKDYLLSIEKHKRENVKIIYGHYVPYGIHGLFRRAPRYITFVRNPFARLVSSYNFLRTNFIKENKGNKNDKVYKDYLLVNEKVPTFDDWFENKIGKNDYANFWLKMESVYKTLRYMNKGEQNIESINRALSKFYFIGVTEKYDVDGYFLYDLLGFKKYYKKQNVSKKYFRNNSNLEKKEKFNSFYKKEMSIYNTAIRHNREFINDRSNFYSTVKSVRKDMTLNVVGDQIVYWMVNKVKRAALKISRKPWVKKSN